MKTKTINMEGRNNRLIAEFMGAEGHPLDQMKYHTSWDWLMPVIEKIETLGYNFEKNYQPIEEDWQSLIVKGDDILYQEFDPESVKASYYVVCKLITDIIKT